MRSGRSRWQQFSDTHAGEGCTISCWIWDKDNLILLIYFITGYYIEIRMLYVIHDIHKEYIYIYIIWPNSIAAFADNDKLQLANSVILSMSNFHNNPSPHNIQLFDELSSSNFMTSLKPASASSIC